MLRNITAVSFALGLLLSAVQPAAGQNIAPSLQTNRTSGVAPLAVFFDAGDSLHTDPAVKPFFDLSYTWDFGDPNAGVWSTDGRSKNTARGPIAAHVYDQPGTYTATVTIADPGGASVTRSVSITVQNPDTVYSGTQTVCVSASGNFTGCPTGAQTVTMSDFDDAVRNYVTTNRRVLFRRGDSFTANGQVAVNIPGPITIGAFGSGAKPQITLTSYVASILNLSNLRPAPATRDWRIMDLSFRSSLFQDEMVVSAQSRLDDMLYYRIDALDFPNPYFFYGAILRFDGTAPHKGLFLVDLTTHRSRRPPVAGSYPVTFFAERSAMLGVTSTNVDSPTHVFRSDLSKRSLFQHNNLRDPEPSRIVFKMHAPTYGALYGYSEENLISENRFHGGNNNWIMTLAPQNSTSDERLRRLLIEGNYFTVGTSTYGRIGILMDADESVIRNNVFELTGDARGSQCVVIRREGAEPDHFGNAVYNNTCVDLDPGVNVTAVSIDAASSTSFGNLVVGASPTSGGVRGTTAQYDVLLTSPPFVTATRQGIGDYQLGSGTPAVDRLPAGPSIRYDAVGNGRRADGDANGTVLADAGALERGGSSGSTPPPSPSPTPPAAPVLLP
jgi:hypothetical protein